MCLLIFFSADLIKFLITSCELFISNFFKLKFEIQSYSKIIMFFEISLLNTPSLILDDPKSMKTFMFSSFIR